MKITFFLFQKKLILLSRKKIDFSKHRFHLIFSQLKAVSISSKSHPLAFPCFLKRKCPYSHMQNFDVGVKIHFFNFFIHVFNIYLTPLNIKLCSVFTSNILIEFFSANSTPAWGNWSK